jgi:hypothetical protein
MKTVTILTMARSGSSLLAGILQRLGVEMGKPEDMKKGQHLNKYGSHENQDFIALSCNILFDVGILLDFLKRLTDYDEEMKIVAEKYRSEFRKLIKKYSGDLWGFKEASLIYYLPYLHDELENPYYIHLERDHNSTANSLLDMISSKHWRHEYHEKRKFFPFFKRIHLYLRILRLLITSGRYRSPEYFKKIVKDAHERIEEFLEKRNHIKIDLDDLVEDSENELDKIISFLEINPTEEQRKAALNFIHPELLTQ